MSIRSSPSVAYSQGNLTWYLVDGLLSELERINVLVNKNRSLVFKAGETL